MKKDKRIFGKVIHGTCPDILLFPIVFMIIFSFNSSKSLTHFTGFSTMHGMQKMFADRDMMESLYITIIVAVLATVISTIVGTISAIGLSKSKKDCA